MSGDQYDYRALAATVRFKDITSTAHNRALLHRIRNNNDPSLESLYISSAENVGDGEFVVREDDDLGWLGYFIGKNITLTALYIDHLPSDNERVVSFFKGVERNETIRRVDFWGDGIADEGEGLSAMNMPYVTSIEAHQLERDSARSFAMGLRRCKSLESYYGRLTAEIIDALGELPLIKSITSSYNEDELNDDTDNFSKEGCIALEKLVRNATKLAALYLDGVGIGDEGMESLAAGLVHNSSLRNYSLSHNNIGDDGVKALAESLAVSRSLRALRLDRNHIGDEGLVCLASSLYHHRGIRELDISANNIGDIGLEALATSLTSNRKLQGLYLLDNNIGDTGLVALATSLLQNRSLRTLDISGNTAITEMGLSALSRTLQSPKCKLERLNLNRLNIRGAGVEFLFLGSALSINKSIVSLELCCEDGVTSIDNDGLRALMAGLRHNDTLQSLDLSGNTAINATGLSHFKQYFWSESCALEELLIIGINVGDEGAFALADALARNKSLKRLLFRPEQSGITVVGGSAFSKLLCGPTSASSIYLSNHTLQTCWGAGDLTWLGVNMLCNNPRMAAKYKILKCLPDLDITLLLQWSLKCLPLVIDWFWFQSITFSRSMRSDGGWHRLAASIKNRELSAIYKFVSGMPGLVVKDYRRYLNQQLQTIQASKSRLLAEMQKLEEREARLMKV